MFKRLLLAAVFTGALADVASATAISGSFSLASFSGSYVNGTAVTATGLDFGTAFSGSGNGFGINGSAIVGNTTGSFVGLNGSLASIADISLGNFANPINNNFFITFPRSLLALSFSDALFTRSPLGTSVTITGAAYFTDGDPADASSGRFSLATSSQYGSSDSLNFTFTSNGSVTGYPVFAVVTEVTEPASLAIIGTSLIGLLLLRCKLS